MSKVFTPIGTEKLAILTKIGNVEYHAKLIKICPYIFVPPLKLLTEEGADYYDFIEDCILPIHRVNIALNELLAASESALSAVKFDRNSILNNLNEGDSNATRLKSKTPYLARMELENDLGVYVELHELENNLNNTAYESAVIFLWARLENFFERMADYIAANANKREDFDKFLANRTIPRIFLLLNWIMRQTSPKLFDSCLPAIDKFRECRNRCAHGRGGVKVGALEVKEFFETTKKVLDIACNSQEVMDAVKITATGEVIDF